MNANFNSERQFPDLHIYSGTNTLGETWVYSVSAFSKAEADRFVIDCDGNMPLSSLHYHGGKMPPRCEFKYHCRAEVIAFLQKPLRKAPPPPFIAYIIRSAENNKHVFTENVLEAGRLWPRFSSTAAPFYFRTRQAALAVAHDVEINGSVPCFVDSLTLSEEQ